MSSQKVLILILKDSLNFVCAIRYAYHLFSCFLASLHSKLMCGHAHVHACLSLGYYAEFEVLCCGLMLKQAIIRSCSKIICCLCWLGFPFTSVVILS